MKESNTKNAGGKKSAPWYVPIFLELETGIKALGFSPLQDYSRDPVPEVPKTSQNSLNPIEGIGTKFLTTRRYLMTKRGKKFITVGLTGKANPSRGFEYTLTVGYGDDEITPILAALQGVKPAEFTVQIDRWEVLQIASKATNQYLKPRALREGEPFTNEVKNRLDYLSQYGIPWAEDGLRDDSFTDSVLSQITSPAMSIAYALLIGKFDIAQSKLDAVSQNRNQRIGSWSLSPDISSRQEAEKAVDARHLSEKSLPNPQYIDGEFIRLAQKAIDDKSIESLLLPQA